MPALEDYSIFDFSIDDKDDGANPTTRIHKDHPLNQVIGDLQSATQTRKMSKNLEEHGFLVLFYKEQTIKTFKIACLLVFLSQEEPKKETKNMPKEYSFAWRGSVDVERGRI
ncbi:hypothetical protein Tco_1294367 [Tanacetum coccineum]